MKNEPDLSNFKGPIFKGFLHKGKSIRFECPNCSKYFTKKGTARKYPQRKYHTHGHLGYEDGWIHRSSHCPHYRGDYIVLVN